MRLALPSLLRGAAALLALCGGALLFGRAGQVAEPRSAIASPPPLTARRTTFWIGLGTALLTLLAGAALAWQGATAAKETRRWAAELTHGDPSRGPDLMRRHGCIGCHRVEGVAGARGTTGPPLEDLADRAFLGGVALNSPEALIRWIRRSRDMDPRSGMPNTNVPEAEARDIAAFLYTR